MMDIMTKRMINTLINLGLNIRAPRHCDVRIISFGSETIIYNTMNRTVFLGKPGMSNKYIVNNGLPLAGGQRLHLKCPICDVKCVDPE